MPRAREGTLNVLAVRLREGKNGVAIIRKVGQHGIEMNVSTTEDKTKISYLTSLKHRLCLVVDYL